MKNTLIFEEVKKEIKSQDEKWGEDRIHHPMEWNAILTEETGEVAKEVVEHTFSGKSVKEMREELIQVAAVAIQWINSIDLQK